MLNNMSRITESTCDLRDPGFKPDLFGFLPQILEWLIPVNIFALYSISVFIYIFSF